MPPKNKYCLLSNKKIVESKRRSSNKREQIIIKKVKNALQSRKLKSLETNLLIRDLESIINNEYLSKKEIKGLKRLSSLLKEKMKKDLS
jgi:hypothetical protein